MQIQEKILSAWLHACEVDILTFKPGNVSIYAAGHNMTADQFRYSSQVSAKHITNFALSLGEKIFYSIQDTRSAVGCNTNLGIVLLCAPLVQAIQSILESNNTINLVAQLHRTLKRTTLKDADWVYKAIRLAEPGGLGHVDYQDVALKPKVTLQQAMQLAADSDRVAYQYATDYKDIFSYGIPLYQKSLLRWGDERWAALALYAGYLITVPDSLIERKHGKRFNRMVANRMVHVNKQLEEFTPDRPEHLISVLKEVDAEFKAAGVNPGTTADLTVTTVFAEGLETLSCDIERMC